jgi:DNA-directed RNA polymerase subunit RPC12/RpoP
LELNEAYCPKCGKIAHYDVATGIVSCTNCGLQHKILYHGETPEEFYEENLLKDNLLTITEGICESGMGSHPYLIKIGKVRRNTRGGKFLSYLTARTSEEEDHHPYIREED